MGNCGCKAESSAVEKKESKKEFKKLSGGGKKEASKSDLARYIDEKAQLWAMLSANIGLSEEKCREIATNVAFGLATGKTATAEHSSVRTLSKEEFHKFRVNYVSDPKGVFSSSVFCFFFFFLSASLTHLMAISWLFLPSILCFF